MVSKNKLLDLRLGNRIIIATKVKEKNNTRLNKEDKLTNPKDLRTMYNNLKKQASQGLEKAGLMMPSTKLVCSLISIRKSMTTTTAAIRTSTSTKKCLKTPQERALTVKPLRTTPMISKIRSYSILELEPEF